MHWSSSQSINISKMFEHDFLYTVYADSTTFFVIYQTSNNWVNVNLKTDVLMSEKMAQKLFWNTLILRDIIIFNKSSNIPEKKYYFSDILRHEDVYFWTDIYFVIENLNAFNKFSEFLGLKLKSNCEISLNRFSACSVSI